MAAIRVGPAVKPHSAPSEHNQFTKDPIAHFQAIPWCAALLSDPAILDVIVVDRRPLPSGESNFVRRVMNSGTTVRACITFFRMLDNPRSNKPEAAHQSLQNDAAHSQQRLPSNAKYLQGGGPADGEDPKNPFLLFNALLDLGEDLCGFTSTLHGGLFAVLMDEVMGTAANFQAPVTRPENGAYTVTFTTNYKKMVKVPQVVLVRGRVVRREGRKLFVRGSIEDKNGAVMAEGEGTWLQMAQNVGRSQL